MTEKIKLAVISLLISTFIYGCSSKPPLEEMEPEKMFSYLQERFVEEKYLDVIEGLEFFTLNYSGNVKVDSAEFLLGQAHFHIKEYLIAADVFNEMNRRFPSSTLVPESMFLIGKCYWELSPTYSLDQDHTYRAIDSFQAFIDYFPERKDQVLKAQEMIKECRSKLGQKQFANGMIYFKMKDYEAAVLYFTGVIEQFYDTDWSAKALYYLGLSYAGNKDIANAREAYIRFLQKYLDHPLTTRVKATLTDLDKMSAKVPD